MRFYMKGNPSKQRLFDFLQGDLESSLEKLVKVHESDWMQHLDQALMMGETYDEEMQTIGVPKPKKTHLGERFFKYKQQVNSLKETLERHFGTVISEIEAGLPSVQVEESKEGDDDEEDNFSKATTWTCIICTTQNPMANPRCSICRTAAPVVDGKSKAKK
jgi:hypothetical protein